MRTMQPDYMIFGIEEIGAGQIFYISPVSHAWTVYDYKIGTHLTNYQMPVAICPLRVEKHTFNNHVIRTFKLFLINIPLSSQGSARSVALLFAATGEKNDRSNLREGLFGVAV